MGLSVLLFGIICFFASRPYSSLGWVITFVNTISHSTVLIILFIGNSNTNYFLLYILITVPSQLFLKLLLTKGIKRLFKKDEISEEQLIALFEDVLSSFWKLVLEKLKRLLEALLLIATLDTTSNLSLGCSTSGE